MKHWSAQDHQFMAEALQLAKRGEFTARPNPMVGCVIVKDGQIVGRGWHQNFGGAHAEVNALQQAGDLAEGACCYVTLEPCAHVGKTGACAQALKAAGISSVIAAMQDPNPSVSGQGFEILQQAGISTSVGLLESQARQLNPGFIARLERARPFVTVKLAMSLDGRTALENGASQWITGKQARADVQRLRARQDVIVTGIGTQQADNPSMTARPEFSEQERLNEQYFRQPLRVLLDRQAKANLKDKFFQQNQPNLSTHELWQAKQVWWLTQQQPTDNLQSASLAHVANSKLESLELLLNKLSKCGANHVLVEAGHRLVGSFLAQGLVDQLVVYMAPKLMGNRAMGLVDIEIQNMQDCIGLKLQSIRQFGDDIRLIYGLEKSITEAKRH